MPACSTRSAPATCSAPTTGSWSWDGRDVAARPRALARAGKITYPQHQLWLTADATSTGPVSRLFSVIAIRHRAA